MDLTKDEDVDCLYAKDATKSANCVFVNLAVLPKEVSLHY